MTAQGTLYGIGIGPGDPDLITLKGIKLLSGCNHVVVPKASRSANSLALQIVRKHLNPEAAIHELVFPMITEQDKLMTKWRESAQFVESLLSEGEDVCFPTLGDTFFYSTYIYLIRALRNIQPEVKIVTIPGVNAFSAVAAATEFAVGEGKQRVTVIPAADDLAELRNALNESNGTVVIMKIGKRLDAVLDLLEEQKALKSSVFASHVGLAEEHLETELVKLRGKSEKTGYLSLILAKKEEENRQ